MASERIGLFGGSFDPIHQGHVAPVVEAAARLELDRVVFLPTANPPHKPDRRLAPALQRYCMVELALLSHERLEVATDELLLSRPAYTVETLEAWRTNHVGSELYLFIGADSFEELDSWRRFEEIPELARLVVLARPGHEQAREANRSPALREIAVHNNVVWMNNRLQGVSSTAIRAALARGERPSPEELCPEVLRFCHKYRLYQ